MIAQDAGGGFEDDHITVAVTVSVLSAPEQARLSTDTEENFEHGLVLSGVPGGLGGENGDLRIAGVVKDGASDLTNPFRIEGANLRPASAGGVAYGDYEVSIGWTHPNFAGELTLLATAAVDEAIVADDVLPAAARDATLTVAAGYSGPGHAIPPSAGYEYLAVGYDETRAAYDAAAGHVIEVLQGSAVTLDLTLAVTVTAGCLASTGRRCSARGLTVSVTFIPVHPFAQERLEAADDEGFRHTIATGGYSPVGMRVKEAVGGRDYWFDLTMAADASWALIPNATTPPEAGRHTVLLGMTHADFRGELELAVTTRIQETLEPADVVAALNPTVDAAPGYFGRGYAISVESGHVLSDESYNATLLGYDAESGVISILSGNPVPDSGELLLTLAGEGSCAARDCRAEAVTVISAFRALRPPAQDIASGAFGSGWTLSLNFPAGYENERDGGRPGRKSELLYPLARTGALAADGESCAALGGTHTAVEDLCAGHAAELDVCTFSSAPAVAARYDSCADAFAMARECNLAGRALRTNDACAASDCGANTFALGGKCLALSLNGLGDLLAHTPQGTDDALNAGTRPLAVGMTQRDAGSEFNSLLGTIVLEARAEIGHLPLDGRFLLSPPHPAATITIAAGTGAVGLELARVSLAESDAVIGAHTRGATDSAGFPENISLRYLPEDGAQTVVFYLSSEPGGNGLRTERTAMLTVASRNLNYGFWAQDVTLEIKALRDPDLAEFGGTIREGKAYNSSVFAGGVLHGFKRGDYETATNFARVAGSSEELLVDAATGEVKTDGNITLAAVYTLAVDATSPDFLGQARLELRLNIGFEGEFQPTDTIGSEDRIREVAVVPGYAGSVAFFSAATMGVTLRTPTVAPVGFSFGGAEALDADFESPAGFTVFLDAGEADRGGETALGAFTVSALAAGFTPLGIELTVSVTALALPEQSTVVRGHLAGEYGSATLLADYSLEDNWVVAGASSLNAAGDAYVPVADWRARLAIAGAAFLRPVDGLEAGERLAAGKYRVTVETTHADFLGTLRLTVPLDIQETLESAAVVSAAGRNATITVAAGHSGDGYAIPVGAGYEVRTVLYDADAAGYDRERDVILIPAGSPIGADDLELAVTLTAGCADAGRNCAPLGLTVTALFIPLQAFAQSALRATSEEDFAAHTVAVGGYAGATLTIAGIAGGEISLFALDGSGGIVRNNDNPPGRGRYTITVEMTHAGFAGTLGLLVTAQIQEALALDDIVPRASRDVTVTVAAGYSGNGYQIPLKTGEHLFQTVLYDAARVDYDLDNHFIRIPAGARVWDEVTLAVTATAGCVDASRDCAPRGLTVSATFVPLRAFAQEELTAFYDEDFAAHRVRVGGYAGDSGAELAIGGITGGDFFELDGTGRRIVRNDGNRPSAGRYIITVEMTHTGDGRTGGFLGALKLPVTAVIAPQPLSAADYSIGEAFPSGVVTVAAGTGAVDFELGRFSLTAAADAPISVFLRSWGAEAFPPNVSLEFLPEEEARTVVFYLVEPVGFDGRRATRTAELTVDSADRNYAPLAQPAVLTITALRKPALAVVDRELAAGASFSEANFYDLRTVENYANASFARDDGASSAELTVDGDGLVSARGDIAGRGTYTLVADATSPDFKGRARLELRLVLRGEGEFSSVDTIPLGRRVQDVLTAPDYSGSVAFFAAGLAGATLRTPSWAPLGFSFGAGGLEATVVSPGGFTLFLEPGWLGTGSAEAVFPVQFVTGVTVQTTVRRHPVSGREREFEVTVFYGPEIGLTVRVSAVRVSTGARRVTRAEYLSGFEADVTFPDGYAGGNIALLYPAPVTGPVVADRDMCEGLGGTYVGTGAGTTQTGARLDVCVGYSESPDFSSAEANIAEVLASRATRGACTFSDHPALIEFAYYSCHKAFESVRDCNMSGMTAKNNSECGEVCAGGTEALGAKCLEPARLNGAGDRVLWEATADDDRAVNAGSRLFFVGITPPDVLGTVRLKVPVEISRRALDAEGYSLSRPHPEWIVTVAAGAGAVGEELARVWLSESATGGIVRETESFPANLSLEFLPSSSGRTVVYAASSPGSGFGGFPGGFFPRSSEQTVVLWQRPAGRTVAFYLSESLGGNGNSVERTARLTVGRGINYLDLEQVVRLRITALRNPQLSVVHGDVAPGRPYAANADIYNFKTGDYATATNFARDAAASSPELLVNVTTGAVYTETALTERKTYKAAVDVTSPDFTGTARLEMWLALGAENVLPGSDVIVQWRRSQQIYAVQGYAGSVAYFLAQRNGVTLRTPETAPAGFNFGAGGLDADFKAPEAGFTLFVNAGELARSDDTATAVFTVRAGFPGYEEALARVTVSVAAVAPPRQETLFADYQSPDYNGYDLTAPANFGLLAATLRIAGVYDPVRGASVADGAERITLAGRRLRPGAEARLDIGEYEVTVGMRHAGFVGELPLVVPTRIETTISRDDIAGERNVVQHVAPMYGTLGAAGRVLTVSAAYALEDLSYDRNRFTVVADADAGEYEVRLTRAISTLNLTAAVTARATCKDAGAGCPALTVTLSVVFSPLAAPVQTFMDAGDGGAAYNHAVVLPASHPSAALRIAGARKTDAPAAAVTDITNRVRAVNGLLQPVGAGFGEQLTLGRYEITVAATQAGADGFLGTLTLIVTARIRSSINPDDVLAARGLTLSVAAGHPALASLALGTIHHRLPTISSDYRLENIGYDTERFVLNTVTYDGATYYEPLLRIAMPNSDVEMRVEADVICETAPSEECAPLRLTVSLTFKPVSGERQADLTGEDTLTAYNHAIVFPRGYEDGTAEIVNAGVLAGRVTIADGKLEPVAGDDPARRLFAGTHEISVRFTHPDFVGALTAVVFADISGALVADAAVPNRNLTAYVVNKWFSNGYGSGGDAGYVIPVNSGHRLSNFEVETDGAVFVEVQGDSGEIALIDPLLAPNRFPVTLKADVTRTDCAGAGCDTLKIFITLVFAALAEPEQADATVSAGDAAYNHRIALPAELGHAGAEYDNIRAVQVDVSAPPPGPTQYGDRLRVDGNGLLQPIGAGLPATDARGTRYRTRVRVSHEDLLGSFDNLFTLHVGKPVSADNVLSAAERNVALDVVEGHFGAAGDAGYRIPFSKANVEVSVSYETSGVPAITVIADSGGHVISLLGSLSAAESVRALTLTAVASCVPSEDLICGRPAMLTVRATLSLLYDAARRTASSPFGEDFAVTLDNIPDKYSVLGGARRIASFASRILETVGEYPLPLEGDVAATRESCEALGGRHRDEGGVESCADYTFSNSAARTDNGGGCVISGGSAEEEQCSTAFRHVRDCNKADKPALSNSVCSNLECAGGAALGGVCPVFSAFDADTTRDALVHDRTEAEVALRGGVHTVAAAITHPKLLGRFVAEAVVTIERVAGPAIRLTDGDSRTVTVAADYTGVIYRGTATDDGGVAVPASADMPAGFSARGGRTVEITLTAGVASGENTSGVFSLTVNQGNVHRAASYIPTARDFILRVEATRNPIPNLPLVTQNIYRSPEVYNFAGTEYAGGVYAGATFTLAGESAHFVVSERGLVGTNGDVEPGRYGVTVTAEDRSASPAFVGMARLTLSLTIGSGKGAGEYVRHPEPIVRVAAGHTGAIHTLATINGYGLTGHSAESGDELLFDAASGVFSIPAGEPLGTSESRRMTVTASVVCPASGRNSLSMNICAPGSNTVIADLNLTLLVVPVLDPEATEASGIYKAASFNSPVALPQISTPTDFGGPGSSRPRFGSGQVTIVLAEAVPPGSEKRFELTNNRVRFNEADPAEPGAYTLVFRIAHADGDGIAGFAGTLRATMSVSVSRSAALLGVAAEDRGAGADGAIEALAAFGDDDAVLLELTPASQDITAAFTAPPPALAANSQYALSYSADRRTLFVSRNPGAALRTLGTTDRLENLATEFTVAATGADAGRYTPKVQRLSMRALQFYDPAADARVTLQHRNEVAPYDAGELADLSQIYISGAGAGGYRNATVYADIRPTVQFYKVSSLSFSAELSVHRDGRVVVSENITKPGRYGVVAEAFSPRGNAGDGFAGRARFTVTLVLREASPSFGGIAVNKGGTIELTNVPARLVPGADRGGALDPLPGVDMVYHGISRGLHWIYGKEYYTSEDAYRNNNPVDHLDAGSQWFSQSICDTEANKGGDSVGWRLPTLIELAGGALPGVETETEIAARVNGFSNGAEPLDIFRAAGNAAADVEFVTLTVQGRNTDDAGPLPAASDAGYFAGLFNAAKAEAGTFRGYPARVRYDAARGEIEASRGTSGKVVCVRTAADLDREYEDPPRWAEVSVDDANNSVVSMTAIIQGVRANVTVGLGLFTTRGAETPEPVAGEFMRTELTVDRLDRHTDIFQVTPRNIEGGVVLEVIALAPAADRGENTFTLSLIFAPDGKYFGLSQRDFGKTVYDEGDEKHLDAVRLTVRWTPPEQEVTPFRFAGADISAIGGEATVTMVIVERNSYRNHKNIVMEYYGNVGGLRVMHSWNQTRIKSNGEDEDPLPYFDQDTVLGTRLCDAGNTGGTTGWRNPTLAELAMLMTPKFEGELEVTIEVGRYVPSSGGKGIPGAREASSNVTPVITVTFNRAADRRNGMVAILTPLTPLKNDIFTDRLAIFSGLVDSEGSPMALEIKFFNTERVGVLKSTHALAVCVQELSGYDGSANPQLAGVAFEGELAVDLAPPDGTAATGKHTITARAYYFNDQMGTGSNTPHSGVTVTLEDAPLLVEYDDSADDGPFHSEDIGAKGAGVTITDGEIVIDFGARAIESGNNALEIKVTPQLGESRTVTVRFTQ